MARYFQPYRTIPFTVGALLLVFLLVLLGYVFLWQKSPAEYFAEATSCYEDVHSHDIQASLCAESVAHAALRIFKANRLLEAAQGHNAVSDKLYCHNFSHSIGLELYKREGKNLMSALKECTDDCFDGCPFSVMERYLRDNYSGEAIADVDTIKSEFYELFTSTCKNARPANFYHCYDVFAHALGHLWLEYANLDMNKALRLCDVLGAPESRVFTACYTGVFMVSTGLPIDKIASRSVFEDCEQINEKYRYNCYHDRFKSVLVDRYSDNIEMCSSFMEDFRRECFARVNIKNTTGIYDLGNFKMACDSIYEKDYKEACIENTATQLALNYMDGAMDMAYAFCDAVYEYSDVCRQAIEKRIRLTNS